MLLLVGFGRTSSGQVVARFAIGPSRSPTVIPLADLSTSWRARQFVAEAVTLPSAATPNQPIRVAGMVVRTAADDRSARRLFTLSS